MSKLYQLYKKEIKMDYVKCCYCDFKGLVNIGQEACPKCEKVGHLAWVDDKKQEILV